MLQVEKLGIGSVPCMAAAYVLSFPMVNCPQATLEARLYKQARRTALLKAQILALQGRPAVYPTESPQLLCDP